MPVPGICGVGIPSAGHAGAKLFAQKAVATVDLFGRERGKRTEGWPETVVVQINCVTILPAQAGVLCFPLRKVGLRAVAQGQSADKMAKPVK